MAAYGTLAQKMGYQKRDIFVLENGQEVIFSKTDAKLGRKIDIKNIYVDEISGGEVESYLIRDREKLSREGIFIILAEINGSTGQLATTSSARWVSPIR